MSHWRSYKLPTEKELWLEGLPNYSSRDLWTVFEGVNEDGESEVDFHILRVMIEDDEVFQLENPPTHDTVDMMYYYTDESGTDQIIYTDGRERRFTKEGDNVLTYMLMDDDISEGLERNSEGFNKPPSTYSHVKVYVETKEQTGWKTLVASGIKKKIPLFTMSIEEMDDFRKRHRLYEEMLKKQPNVNISLFDFLDI